MKEYHIPTLKNVSAIRLSLFQEKDNGNYKYDRLIIDDGYRGTCCYDKPKFGFIFERAAKIESGKRDFTMTKFKACAQYIDVITKYYAGEQNEDLDLILQQDEQIYVKAQVESDKSESYFDGSHCSLVLKLVGFRWSRG